MELNTIREISALLGLQSLPNDFVDCVITSPPYYGLRDYGHPDQIGLEKTPDEYIENLTLVFEEVRRVLKPDGTLWLNLGDSYCGTGTGTGDQASSTLQGGKKTQIEAGKRPDKKPHGDIKPKDLMGIPWMMAFALRKCGWWLRQDNIWSKPNPMPESVTDRCTKSHEYLFMFSKSSTYYFDYKAIQTDAKPDTGNRYERGRSGESKVVNGVPGQPKHSFHQEKPNTRKSGNLARKDGSARGCPEDSGSNVAGSVPWEGEKANKRSVWVVPTKNFPDAHFATFPPKLIVDCIKAGTKEGGLILDPFIGSGTTAVVARKYYRNFIGFELNPDYIKIANKRIQTELGIFI